MKTIKSGKCLPLIIFMLLLSTVFYSCKKGEELGEAPRLFRPTIKGALTAGGNYINASWLNVKDAKSYIVQISKDNFNTIEATLKVDSSKASFENLLWEQLYQVQVIAVAADTTKNSKVSFLGEIKTPRFPTIVLDPQLSDVGAKTILFKWKNEGAAVTTVKVILTSNNSVVQTINLTNTDINNAYLLIANLSGETAYKIELYSGEKFRGANNYVTKAVVSGIVIDLTAITGRPNVLADTIPLVPATATIILKRGMVYSMSGVTISKPVTIMSSDDPLIPAQATIFFDTGSNFNLVANTSLDYINFTDVTIKSNDATGKYVFNPNSAGTIGAITFEGCNLQTLRGVARFRGALTINSIGFNNCVIDSIGGYGVVTVDDVNTKVKSITVTNSTISRAEVIVVSKGPGESVKINNSTFYRAPLGGKYIVDYTSGTLSGTLEFSNNILGPGKATAATPPVVAVIGYRAITGAVNGSNSYTTSDFVWATSGVQFPGVTAYTKKASEIFMDPANGNFKIKDTTFPGRSTAGAPRWRP